MQSKTSRAGVPFVCVLCRNESIDEAYIRAFFERIKSVNNTPDAVLDSISEPVLLVVLNTKSADAIFKWGAKQAYLAMGNMLTVCATARV